MGGFFSVLPNLVSVRALRISRLAGIIARGKYLLYAPSPYSNVAYSCNADKDNDSFSFNPSVQRTTMPICVMGKTPTSSDEHLA